MGYYLLPRYEDGLTPDYIQLAEQERARLWNIAKAYMLTPSLPNVFRAIGAAWNALPFNTTAATVNPYMQYGDVPSANGPKNWLEILKVLLARKAASLLKAIKPARKASRSPYDGLTPEEIEARRQQLSAAGKIGGLKSGSMRSLGLIIQPQKQSVVRKNTIKGMQNSLDDALLLNPYSKPSMYSKPGKIYNNGAITANDLDW